MLSLLDLVGAHVDFFPGQFAWAILESCRLQDLKYFCGFEIEQMNEGNNPKMRNHRAFLIKQIKSSNWERLKIHSANFQQFCKEKDWKVTRLQLPDVCGWLYCVPQKIWRQNKNKFRETWLRKHRFKHKINWNEPWVKSRALSNNYLKKNVIFLASQATIGMVDDLSW